MATATSILLAKVFGLFLLFCTVYMLAKTAEVRRLYRKIPDNLAVLRTAGMLDILLGLFIVIGHPVWSGWPIIISLIGALAIAEGLFYLFVGQEKIKKMYEWFLSPTPFYISAVIGLVLGIYLAYVGFGI